MVPAILLYLVVMGVIVAMRPPISYNQDGSLKRFGLGKHETMFPLWIVAILVAVVVGFVYSLVSGSATLIETITGDYE
jgi:multisubunit Na+/H+ antiporter MnhC subunit